MDKEKLEEIKEIGINTVNNIVGKDYDAVKLNGESVEEAGKNTEGIDKDKGKKLGYLRSNQFLMPSLKK